ncbi:MAG: glycosyltransferase family 2 protein [Clostridiales bacterium]|nr:glycosyltransferase family 2 protein [Clostridiales bacterium]
MDISVIIVNYNTKKLCEQTVKAVLDNLGDLSAEIIIADNSSVKSEVFSSDDSRVKVFSGLPNKGFGTASNYGAKKASGDYILFLNSDTVMQPGTLPGAVSYMKSHPETGCLGIKTLLEDGSFDHGCKRGFPTPFNSFCYFLKLDRLFPKNKAIGGYRLTYIDENDTSEVECVSGAFMLMPKEVFRETKGFDEEIFMHGEDIDLCYRIRLTGRKIVYLGDVYMIHLKGRSSLYEKGKESIKNFYNGITYVYDKYYTDSHGKTGAFLFHSAIKLKYYITLLRHYISGGK